MGLGAQIRDARKKLGRTQTELADETGLGVSYLSRLENERVSPSVKTLSRISEALDIPITAFFESHVPMEAGDRCPVSLSGKCILDHLFRSSGRRPDPPLETYSREELATLRLCNFLLQRGDKRTVTAMRTLMEALATQYRDSE